MTMTDIFPLAQGEALWREHESYINKVAEDTARSYWKVDKEDVLQEIWVFLWQKERYFIEQERTDAYVRTCIKNVVYNYAQSQRNSTLLETDFFYFNVDEVKAFLPTYFSGYEAWLNTSVPFGAETMTPGDSLEMFCDFSRVFEKLTEGQKAILLRAYSDDEDMSQDATARKTLSRAMKRFMELLNQDKHMAAQTYNGPGSRKAISNSVGQHLVKTDD